MNEQQSNRTFDTKQAAAYLHVEPRTMEFWRASGRGPRFLKYSARCVRYLESDLIEFQARRRVGELGGEVA
jgi:hypothetical protein